MKERRRRESVTARRRRRLPRVGEIACALVAANVHVILLYTLNIIEYKYIFLLLLFQQVILSVYFLLLLLFFFIFFLFVHACGLSISAVPRINGNISTLYYSIIMKFQRTYNNAVYYIIIPLLVSHDPSGRLATGSANIVQSALYIKNVFSRPCGGDYILKSKTDL